jgi:UDP-GlcNAc:undecaprenyl-phosphate GlcNAc-1-phosphate transferase
LIGPYAAVFAAAFLPTLALTPVISWICVRQGIVVQPGERLVHDRATPNIGGAAMFVGTLCGLGVGRLLVDFDDVYDSSSVPLGVVAAASIVFLTGFIDEVGKVRRRGVSAPAKMAGLVFGGTVLSLAGLSTLFFRVPFLGVFSLTPDLSTFITVMWVVGMANAINLIDGLDGLAAGITAIAAGAFFLYAWRLDQVDVIPSGNIGALLAIVTLGICLGFLPWNFHPARIFMGDCGALLLGTLMAASTMAVGGSTDQDYSGQSYFFFAPLFIPLVILGVPILDTAFAIARRATRRTGVSTADKEHLHHRLMRLGHGQRRSVLILWAWTALLSALVLYPTYTGRGDAVVPVFIAALALILYTTFHPQIRQTRSVNGHGVTPVADGPDVAGAPKPPVPSGVTDLVSRPVGHGRGPMGDGPLEDVLVDRPTRRLRRADPPPD